jgi:hypothetical protein
MSDDTREIAGIRVGRPAVDRADPTHVTGVRTGNMLGNYQKSPGHLPNGCSTARRSTGINPEAREPILAEMPNLSPP